MCEMERDELIIEPTYVEREMSVWEIPLLQLFDNILWNVMRREEVRQFRYGERSGLEHTFS